MSENDDLRNNLAEQKVLAFKIKKQKDIRSKIIEKARDIRNLTDSESEMARLLKDLVNSRDDQTAYEKRLKDLSNSVKGIVDKYCEGVLEFKYDLDDTSQVLVD